MPKKNTNLKEEFVDNQSPDLDIEEINLDNIDLNKKVTLINLAPWNIGFTNHVVRGDTTIEPLGRTRLHREEIIEQVQQGNKLLKGIDDFGSHATLYIDDKVLREYLEFDGKERKQNVISTEKVKAWFEIKNIDTFKNTIKKNVITTAEKRYLLTSIKNLNFDSYSKIEFCKEYCKFKFTNVL